eukprot:109702_1
MFKKDHDTKQVSFGIDLALSIISILIIAYFAYNYYKRLDPERYRQRYGSITVIEAIITIVNIIATIIAMAISMYADSNHYATKLWSFIFNLLFHISLIVLFSLWTYRFWLLRFKMFRYNACAQTRWMIYIDPNLDIQNDSWYVQNKQTCGSPTYWPNLLIWFFYNLVLILYVSFTLKLFYFSKVSNEVTLIINLSYDILHFALLIPLICLYTSINQYQDAFFVVKELFWILVTLVIYLVVLFVTNLVWYIKIFDEHASVHGILNVLQIVFIFSKCIIMLIATCWVSRKLT